MHSSGVYELLYCYRLYNISYFIMIDASIKKNVGNASDTD